MRACRLLLLLLALCAACTDSCGCGEDGGTDSETGSAAPSQGPAGAGTAALDLAKVPPTSRDAGPGFAARPNWTDAPDSELTRKLQAAKAALETEKVFPKLVEQEALAKLLPNEVGGYEADAPAATTVREGGGAELAVAARSYREGDKTLRIKVTDTAKLPGARRTVSGRLTMIGNEAVGNERGVLVRGNNPAVTAHYARQRVSRASAMVGDRFLLQVMVKNTDRQDEALRVLQQLDWSKLGR